MLQCLRLPQTNLYRRRHEELILLYRVDLLFVFSLTVVSRHVQSYQPWSIGLFRKRIKALGSSEIIGPIQRKVFAYTQMARTVSFGLVSSILDRMNLVEQYR